MDRVVAREEICRWDRRGRVRVWSAGFLRQSKPFFESGWLAPSGDGSPQVGLQRVPRSSGIAIPLHVPHTSTNQLITPWVRVLSSILTQGSFPSSLYLARQFLPSATLWTIYLPGITICLFSARVNTRSTCHASLAAATLSLHAIQ